ncbi:class F sortase [Pseudosporangium ferrugineum]|uniref:Sortase family protein n=1 Tax=Pseudosporangium ferrugineum TaxID=439699 RepID=A0A2T0S8W5_9ACTN|nr:sortase family protein [Pseudosporangium ferrugineum]
MTGGIGAPRGVPGRAALPLLAGVVLLAAFGIAACRSRTAPDVGGATVSALASAAPSPSGPAPAVVVRDGAPPAGTGVDGPTGLRIPALGLTATVDPVGVSADGEFDVPPSVDRVGWYEFGPGLSARAGSIVIAGHVDSADQGRGAFFRLGALTAGDAVTLTGASGGREFEVVARERYTKTAIPLAKYFARDGRPRLTLITCGGPFDRRTGHYRDNVVVTAVPR